MHFWRTISFPRNNSMQVDVSKRYLKVGIIRTSDRCFLCVLREFAA